MATSIIETLQPLRNLLPKNAEVYIVGGAVRDELLHRAITDIDVVVRGMTMDELQAALAVLGPVATQGKAWGVLGCTVGAHQVDVALPRTDAAPDSGEYFSTTATIDPSLPIAADLKRRDFTVNAMALNVWTGERTDPYHGQEDCVHKILRTVGNPIERFAQDHSRILRCLRFATQLGFAIEPITWEGLRTVVQQVEQLEIPKRIWERELAKVQGQRDIFNDWVAKAGLPTYA